MHETKDMLTRPVNQNDMQAVVNLLQEISLFTPSQTDYVSIWNTFIEQPNVYSIVVEIGGEVVGYGSILIESKIRGGKLGHVEDIVSSSKHRTRGVGRAILDSLLKIAIKNNCYKLALQCKDYNINFYEKCGYELNGVSMQMLLSKF